ncbi:unnamed protein product [Nezara viridula]|uniref:Endothelin-converting enzyme 1 n=1 Tax=Nezara viridula TaxID=85310 RepID=A0A9P0MMP2_NEZVI|nr:unnamed protein product [Nezara viridula]
MDVNKMIDETDDSAAKENDPCLPSSNSFRKSMESLSKKREIEQQNSSVLDVEKNKNIENTNSYTLKQEKKKSGLKVTIVPPSSKFEEWLTQKTGLSRPGLLVAGVLILLLLILILTVVIMTCLWPDIPHSMMFPLCRAPACLLAASEVLSKMNQNVNPCEDFREYACGHWLNTQSIPNDKSLWNVKQAMQFKNREHLRNLITTMPYPTDVEQFQWRLKNIYDSCMSVGSVETEGSQPLKKLIHSLGGWHVLREFSVQTWDMSKTLRTLHAKYNIQPFFSVEVVPDAKSPQQSIIQISPGSLGLPDKSYYYRKSDDKVILAYKRFAKDVALTLGATSTDATTFSDDLFGFERRLAERFPSRLPDRTAHYRPTISKLEEIAPSVPFYDILTAMFPEAKLSKKSEIVVIASDHLVNVSHIISTTDRSALNDYMMWRLTVGFLPFLSKLYRSTINEFHKNLYGIKDVTPRWEMCIETLQKYVGYGLEAMSESANTDLEKKSKVVNDIFDNIKLTVKDSIQNSKSLPLHIQEHFLDKLNTIGIQVGLPSSMRFPSYYNDFYRSLTSIKDDFFQNILYGTAFYLEEQQRRLKLPSEEHRWMDIVSDGLLKVVYVPEINKVVIPMGLLSMPYFHVHYPMSVLYGSIGMEIGLAILGSVSGRGAFHAGDGVVLPPDHPAHNSSHDCFLHDTGPYINSVKHVFGALSRQLDSVPHIHQPAMEYLEDEAIFFISYAQGMCTLKTAEKQDIEMTTLKSKLDDLNLLQIMKLRAKPFSSTFSCNRSVKKDECDSMI